MRESQCDMILKFMEEEGSITQLDATREFGCTRLAARINDLKRKRGIPIKAVKESTKNRYGKSVIYARYSMSKGD